MICEHNVFKIHIVLKSGPLGVCKQNTYRCPISVIIFSVIIWDTIFAVLFNYRMVEIITFVISFTFMMTITFWKKPTSCVQYISSVLCMKMFIIIQYGSPLTSLVYCWSVLLFTKVSCIFQQYLFCLFCTIAILSLALNLEHTNHHLDFLYISYLAYYIMKFISGIWFTKMSHIFNERCQRFFSYTWFNESVNLSCVSEWNLSVFVTKLSSKQGIGFIKAIIMFVSVSITFIFIGWPMPYKSMLFCLKKTAACMFIYFLYYCTELHV